jgi:hypothetical protein
MPNWCDCELTFHGNARDIKRFVEFAKEDDENMLSAEKFIPYPKKYADLDKKTEKWDKRHQANKKHGLLGNGKSPTDGFNQGGYQWCIANWGTKWGFCDVELEHESAQHLKYGFQTAWSPPIPLIRAMGKRFPKLRFYLQYFEDGMGFQGEVIFERGTFTESTNSYNGDRGG